MDGLASSSESRLFSRRTALALIGSASAFSGIAAAGQNQIAFPSSRFKIKGDQNRCLDFILFPQSDVRSLFCDKAILEDRILRKVAAIDFHVPKETSFELPVGVGQDVGVVLAAVYQKTKFGRLQKWTGSPEIVHVAQRSISFLSPIAIEHRVSIMSGDILVIQSIY